MSSRMSDGTSSGTSHGTPAPSDHGHGHGDAHGGGHTAVAEAGAADVGHADFPPEPKERHITPAPEDFRDLPGVGALFWPFLWAGLAVLLIAALLKGGWPQEHAEHAEHAPDAHAAPVNDGPAHGEPTHGEPTPSEPGHR